MTQLKHFLLMTLCLLCTSLFAQSSALCKAPANLKGNPSKDIPLSANINWKSIPGVPSYSIKIQDAKTEDNAPYNVVLTSNTNSIYVNNFPAKGKYKFQVRSNCAVGPSKWSYTSSFTLR